MACLRSSSACVPCFNSVQCKPRRFSQAATLIPCASGDDRTTTSGVQSVPPDAGVQQAVDQELSGFPWPIDKSSECYEGVYGPWQVTEEDVKEVLAYRAGIILAASCSALTFAGGLAGPQIFPAAAMNALCLLATLGFGTSLVLIHIYVSEIKGSMQVLFALGVLGELWLGVTQSSSSSIATYVSEHPSSTWLIGPAFAALTGVAIKEGLCYGKPEAGLLALITPVWLLGHLSGAFSPQADSVAAAMFVAVFGVFAARKVSQAVKDDIGDGSVFLFRKLSEEDQMKLLRKLGKAPNYL